MYMLPLLFISNTALVMLVILSVLLENSGLLKAGGRTTEFEPLQQTPVKFSDVHGIDEVKQAWLPISSRLRLTPSPGTC